eukprot:jgi/Mesvir1/649/Mv17261-RA.1
MAAASNSTAVQQLLRRKEKLEDELRSIEKQVFDLETAYLQDSSAYGNVLKGFEGFLSTNRNSNTSSQKRGRPFKTEDRLFSLSSITSPVVEIQAAREGAAEAGAAAGGPNRPKLVGGGTKGEGKNAKRMKQSGGASSQRERDGKSLTKHALAAAMDDADSLDGSVKSR